MGSSVSICGLAAGHSFPWTSTIPELIPTSYQAFRQSLSGEPSEIQLAIEFRNLVSKWWQDQAGLAIARTRLLDLERSLGKPLTDNLRQYHLDCARLGIMLNSLSDLEIDDLTAIRRWASQHDQGWPILFYAAGILLSVESGFPSGSVISGVLMYSHAAKEKVKLLLDHYSQGIATTTPRMPPVPVALPQTTAKTLLNSIVAHLRTIPSHLMGWYGAQVSHGVL